MVLERLTLESAQDGSVLACEHRHRYELAAPLCADRRVLDLCCGSGYGTVILAGQAREVVGVDHDAATVDLAQAQLGERHANTVFLASDALAYLRRDEAARFEVLVCFEGLEHLPELPRVLEALREHAHRGMRMILSVPNDRAFGERNPYHLTDFGYDEAMAAFAGFPATEMVPQFIAEGSLICPPRARASHVQVVLDERLEPEYAHHFLFFVNFSARELTAAHDGRLQACTAPVFNRWSQEVKQALAALRRENARLARERLGKGGSAAASALAVLQAREAEVEVLRERLRLAEARVQELEKGRGVAESKTTPAA